EAHIEREIFPFEYPREERLYLDANDERTVYEYYEDSEQREHQEEDHDFEPFTDDEDDIEQYSDGYEEEERGDEEAERRREAIRELREADNESDLLYSRRCGICFVSNATRRAVFSSCGHIACLACTLQIADSNHCLDCPFCRKKTRYVRIFEEIKDENEEEEDRIKISPVNIVAADWVRVEQLQHQYDVAVRNAQHTQPQTMRQPRQL
ncbi:hypothetical protein PFISCL1PPCAC_4151, partial [Pristionchus fissidentatus]